VRPLLRVGIVIALLGAGCGRVGFEPLTSSPSLDGGAIVDAGPRDAGSGSGSADGGAAVPLDAGPPSPGDAWTVFLTSAGEVTLWGVAVDDDGRVAAAARHDDAIEVGGEELPASGRFSSFLASWDREGTPRWVRPYRSDDLLDFRALAASPEGDLFVTGILQGTATIGADTFVTDNSQDIPYLVHDASGALTAARVFVSGRRNAQGRALAVHGNEVLLVGLYGSTLDVSPATLPTLSEFSAFTVAVDRSGTPSWAAAVQDLGQVFGDGAGLDEAGGCAVGWFEDRVDVAGELLTSNGERDIWIVGYDLAGGPRFARGVGGLGLDEANDAAATPEGRCVVAGQFRDTVDFGGDSRSAAGGLDGFVAVYEPDGVLAWVRTLGGPGDDAANSVDIDDRGRIYVGGGFSETADLGGAAEVTSAGGRDAFVASFEADGTARWARGMGGDADEAAGTLAVEATGQAVVFGGVFSGTTTIGDRTVRSAGSLDSFFHRMVAPF
jgi:hypothetical protein